MISLQNLFFSYGSDFEIHIKQLTIARGEKVAFVGESGCGKTTLVSLIAGVLRSNAGQITIADQQIHNFSDKQLRQFRLRSVGFVFQNFELLDYLNVTENILLPFTLLFKKATPQTLDKLDYLLNAMSIKNKATHKPHQLSQGEKQRVAIARALIHQPSIVIADEPTGNLDPKNSKKIMDLLWKEINEQTTFLMITHDHSLLNQFDRVIHVGEKGLEE
ncbi:ABC transporter ATP-binding protein [Candidatus Uabimicrobium sp. HlEnr_7]|uniref:ABC transporter ATP-binding protein n=1 Tax=Candidatus Uabimicrobium helgolandensis TaxID=3095367 RepID=UPI003557DC69